MYIAQVPRTPGVHLVGIADLSPDNARENLKRVGWNTEAYSAASLDKALKSGQTHLSDNWQRWSRIRSRHHYRIDRQPARRGRARARRVQERQARRDVTVEADAFCGPLLAKKAAEAGVVYSLAYGDQPAIICDLVDWARAAGFPVVAAGAGTSGCRISRNRRPRRCGPLRADAGAGAARRPQPKMFNSFLDGSKPSLETTAVCNATGLTPAPEGLLYPPGSVDEIPALMRPRQEGGVLHHKGQVEVILPAKDGAEIPTTSALACSWCSKAKANTSGAASWSMG